MPSTCDHAGDLAVIIDYDKTHLWEAGSSIAALPKDHKRKWTRYRCRGCGHEWTYPKGADQEEEKGTCVIEKDRAGWGSCGMGHVRFTCLTCQDTLLFQPWMSQEVWIEKKTAFLEKHPVEAVLGD